MNNISRACSTGGGLLFWVCLVLPLFLAGCATPLVKAVGRNDLSAVKELLAKGANPNEVSVQSPLCWAAGNGEIDVMKALLEKGADIAPANCHCCGSGWDRVCYFFKVTGLGIAALGGHEDAVRFLADKGADLDDSISTMEGKIIEFPQCGDCTTALSLLKQMARKRELPNNAPTAGKGTLEAHAAIKSDADQPRYSRAEQPEDFAVVVGVEKYSGLPEARFAVHDAQALRDHLLALGYPSRNIMLLTDQLATRAGLVKTVDAWLPNRVGENSTVFFYYSGHGAPDPKSNMAYLVPVDGDPEYLEQTAYPLKTLYQKLDALKAKRVIVALDSCFSGAGGRSVLAKDARPLVNKIDLGATTTGKIVTLSASKSDQISGAVEDQGHGTFTYFLLKGLNGGAQDDDGHVTLKSLYDYLAPKVADAARLDNHAQEPQIIPAIGDTIDARLR